MRRRAGAELAFVLILAACATHAPETPFPSGWYQHPNPSYVAVRLRPGETIFLAKYDVYRRGNVEHPNGLCMDPLDGSPSELRTTVDVGGDGAVTLVEETNRPGQCTWAPKAAITRTPLVPIRDRARVDALEGELRAFDDPAACKKYDACCEDRTRENWDIHCEHRRNFPQGCWSHWLMMNDDRACP